MACANSTGDEHVIVGLFAGEKVALPLEKEQQCFVAVDMVHPKSESPQAGGRDRVLFCNVH